MLAATRSLVAGVALLLVAAACGDGDPSATEVTATTPAAGLPTTTHTGDPTTPITVVEEPVAELPAEIRNAVEPWDTDWSRRTIDLEELVLGIPSFDPRDLIAPLDSPGYETVQQATAWMTPAEIGLELLVGERALFYPFRILTAHEIVNDEIEGIPLAVTYCPLCNTAVTFDRRVEGRVLRFGVSGLLRKSDLVMWDDATTSLWQQISGEGIVGSLAGARLDVIPTAIVAWSDFAERHPEGEVLSRDTGFGYSYATNGYVGYSSQGRPFGGFFREEVDERYPAMERVVGVRVGDESKSYPFSEIQADRAVDDTVGGRPVAVWWAATEAVDQFDSVTPGEGLVIGTGIAFFRTVDGADLTFAPGPEEATFVDDQTGSTWTIFGEAIAGPLSGVQLQLAPHQNEFWFAWAAFNEGSPVYTG